MSRPPFDGLDILEPEKEESTLGRLTIPSGVVRFVKWYRRDSSQKCLALVAPQGGLAVFSPSELQRREAIRERLSVESVGPATILAAPTRLAQALSAGREVTLQRGGRFRPPTFARDLGILPPSATDPVGLLAYSGVLHFWIPAELRDYLRELTATWGELVTPYLEDEEGEES